MADTNVAVKLILFDKLGAHEDEKEGKKGDDEES